jgi:hypothetical protein
MHGIRYSVAPVTYTYHHPILQKRVTIQVGQLIAPSFNSIKELARQNMEYDKK